MTHGINKGNTRPAGRKTFGENPAKLETRDIAPSAPAFAY
jgi:hypothetical protein